LVITLKPGAKIENLDCIQAGKIAGKIVSLNAYLIQFKNESEAQAARDCLSGNPDVDSIDSNFTVDRTPPLQPLDASVAPDFNLKVNQPSGDCPIVIGLVDTGSTVPASLKNLVRPPMSVFANSQSPAPGDLTHGTAMQDTMAEMIQNAGRGSTSVQIQPMDVYGGNATTTTFDVAQGIYKVITQGHANIINLSLGSPGDSSVLHNVIRQASEQGVVFFAAAGNEPVTTPTYPAAYPEVFAVTAGERNGQVSNYANRGNFVDMMAPGTSIVPFDGQSYFVTGTSTATAYVSGLVAGMADLQGNCPSEVIPAVRAKLGVSFQ
ncbi:MAG TPA: S8 family serine peptidase, partial [Verrucomicrobiae bacterium]|nr:S8 family serine peptidase [Verrucomicrobiae bacterium]